MELDPVLLARIQFGFTITFHIIFPSFTIGLAAFIATLLVRWRMTGRDHLHRLARFWTKIFAVSFAMGVVSGIVLSYQFGTNWSNFTADSTWMLGGTRFQPKSMMPRNVASRKNAVSTS